MLLFKSSKEHLIQGLHAIFPNQKFASDRSMLQNSFLENEKIFTWTNSYANGTVTRV